MPFRSSEHSRGFLAAELDVFCTRLYGLTRKQLRYILDPREDLTCPGEDLLPDDPDDDVPGETFRVLK